MPASNIRLTNGSRHDLPWTSCPFPTNGCTALSISQHQSHLLEARLECTSFLLTRPFRFLSHVSPVITSYPAFPICAYNPLGHAEFFVRHAVSPRMTWPPGSANRFVVNVITEHIEQDMKRAVMLTITSITQRLFPPQLYCCLTDVKRHHIKTTLVSEGVHHERLTE